MKVFLTGIAGFIGFYVAKKLADNGHEVLGVDILNDYYDPSLKYERLKILGFDYEHIDSGKVVQSNRYDNLSFVYLDILDKKRVLSLFSCYKFTHVCHLLAQAGIRDSIKNPIVIFQLILLVFLMFWMRVGYIKIILSILFMLQRLQCMD